MRQHGRDGGACNPPQCAILFYGSLKMAAMPYLESIRVFTRTVELGSITAGGRDNRLTPAVASNRIKELEQRLGVRLFNRTTRKLTPTEIGLAFYDAAKRVLEAVEEAEAAVAAFSMRPKGALKVTAPLGLGRRVVAPLVPGFHDAYPEIEVRLRMSDRKVDLLAEAVDVAFALGSFEDSSLKMRTIAECERVICAAPAYLARHGVPEDPEDLTGKGHRCLLLRFPGSKEYYWTLATPDGPVKLNVAGPYDADDGEVLTEWALEGAGIVNKPRFEVAEHLASGALVRVLPQVQVQPVRFSCLYPHRRLQDPKVQVFIRWMVERCRRRVRELLGQAPGPDETRGTARDAPVPQ
jgi:DNA-binding transcriptional LysR family regulator